MRSRNSGSAARGVALHPGRGEPLQMRDSIPAPVVLLGSGVVHRAADGPGIARDGLPEGPAAHHREVGARALAHVDGRLSANTHVEVLRYVVDGGPGLPRWGRRRGRWNTGEVDEGRSCGGQPVLAVAERG